MLISTFCIHDVDINLLKLTLEKNKNLK